MSTQVIERQIFTYQEAPERSAIESIWKELTPNLEAQAEPAAAPKQHSYSSCSSKRLIARACRQVLDNPKASVREKLQAASLLEKIVRLKDLASHRRAKQKKVKNSPSAKSDRLADLLEHAG